MTALIRARPPADQTLSYIDADIHNKLLAEKQVLQGRVRRLNGEARGHLKERASVREEGVAAIRIAVDQGTESGQTFGDPSLRCSLSLLIELLTSLMTAVGA